MIVDSAPQQTVTLISNRQSEAADDWQKIKGQQSGGSEIKQDFAAA